MVMVEIMMIMCQVPVVVPVVVFIVPGYCPLRILGRFDNTGRKLELIARKIENFLSISRITKNIER